MVVGVDAPSPAAGDSDADWLAVVLCDVVLASSVGTSASVVLLAVGTSAVLSSAGAGGFGLDFLRGPMALWAQWRECSLLEVFTHFAACEQASNLGWVFP